MGILRDIFTHRVASPDGRHVGDAVAPRSEYDGGGELGAQLPDGTAAPDRDYWRHKTPYAAPPRVFVHYPTATPGRRLVVSYEPRPDPHYGGTVWHGPIDRGEYVHEHELADRYPTAVDHETADDAGVGRGRPFTPEHAERFAGYARCGRVTRYAAGHGPEQGVMTDEQHRLAVHALNTGDRAAWGALGDHLAENGFPVSGGLFSSFASNPPDMWYDDRTPFDPRQHAFMSERNPIGSFRYAVLRDGSDLVHTVRFAAGDRHHLIARRERPAPKPAPDARYAHRAPAGGAVRNKRYYRGGQFSPLEPPDPADAVRRYADALPRENDPLVRAILAGLADADMHIDPQTLLFLARTRALAMQLADDALLPSGDRVWPPRF